jgi:hypothetical protein
MAENFDMEKAKRKFVEQANKFLEQRKEFRWIEPGYHRLREEELKVEQSKALDLVEVDRVSEVRVVDEIPLQYRIDNNGPMQHRALVNEGSKVWSQELSLDTKKPTFLLVGKKEEKSYAGIVFQKGEKEVYYLSKVSLELVMKEEDMEGAIAFQFYHRYLRFEKKNGDKVNYVQIFDRKKNSLVLTPVHREDPYDRKLLESLPLTLFLPPLQEDGFYPEIMPEKMLYVLTETVNVQKGINIPWKVSWITVEKGQQTQPRVFFIKEAGKLLEERGIKGLVVPLEVVRYELLLAQDQGYVIIGKGLEIEVFSFLGPYSAAKPKPGLKDGYFLHTQEKYPSSNYPFSIAYCQHRSSIRNGFNMYYCDHVTKKEAEERITITSGVGDLQMQLVHWRITLDFIYAHYHWCLWSDVYEKGSLPPLMGITSYWDSRIVEFPPYEILHKERDEWLRISGSKILQQRASIDGYTNMHPSPYPPVWNRATRALKAQVGPKYYLKYGILSPIDSPSYVFSWMRLFQEMIHPSVWERFPLQRLRVFFDVMNIENIKFFFELMVETINLASVENALSLALKQPLPQLPEVSGGRHYVFPFEKKRFTIWRQSEQEEYGWQRVQGYWWICEEKIVLLDPHS